MSTHFSDDRRMIPRWYPSERAFANGEMAGVSTDNIAGSSVGPKSSSLAQRVATFANDSLNSLIADWRNSPTLGYAADLVSAASVAAPPREMWPVLRDAVEFTLDHEGTSPLLHGVATGLLGRIGGRMEVERNWTLGSHATPTTTSMSAREAAYIAVRRHRTALRRYPYDPIAWVDLALAHVSLGSDVAAERAMRTALGIAPQHRFVLRSATRLFIHLGAAEHAEGARSDLQEEAWERLRKSPAAKQDPWLAAAEIGAAMTLGRAPRSLKTARQLLASGRFAPFDLGELAGALGSLEFEAGATRSGRRLFAQALESPTENTVAQASWISQHASIDLLADRHAQLERSAEGRAWDDFKEQRWKAAVDQVAGWKRDEPFSRRPFLMASFIASGPLGDFQLGAELGAEGLLANPHDIALRNNVAFAYASMGNTAAAQLALGSPRRVMETNSEERIAWVATQGLIQFRRGNYSDGRQIYEMAIDAARRIRQLEMECLATIYLAREELIARQPEGEETYARASRLLKRHQKAYLAAVFKQVTSLRVSQNHGTRTGPIARPS